MSNRKTPKILNGRKQISFSEAVSLMKNMPKSDHEVKLMTYLDGRLVAVSICIQRVKSGRRKPHDIYLIFQPSAMQARRLENIGANEATPIEDLETILGSNTIPIQHSEVASLHRVISPFTDYKITVH
jgi:hypothetical protein